MLHRRKWTRGVTKDEEEDDRKKGPSIHNAVGEVFLSRKESLKILKMGERLVVKVKVKMVVVVVVVVKVE